MSHLFPSLSYYSPGCKHELFAIIITLYKNTNFLCPFLAVVLFVLRRGGGGRRGEAAKGSTKIYYAPFERRGEEVHSEPDSRNHLEWAPPVRIVAFVTLIASTLDLMADLLVCNRIAEFLGNFQSQTAILAAYGYFFFTGNGPPNVI